MNICTACKTDFTSVTAFDAHHNDNGKPVKCNLGVKHPKSHPTLPGKPVLERKGSRNGMPLYKLADSGNFDWAKDGGKSTYVKVGSRPCKGCGGEMRKRSEGRGRFPSNCEGCGGTGVLLD
jgi:hypothetical protein